MKGRNDTEQRNMIHAGRESWELSYPRLTLAERNALLAFHDARKGSFDQDIVFTLLGETFSNCYLAADALEFTENEPTIYSGTVKLSQVMRAPDVGVLPTDFPALANGCVAQRPFVHGHTWSTLAVQTEGGRYARSNRASVLRTWSAGGSSLDYDEAADIWEMFRLARGMWKTFAFTDPESSTRYTNCRFGSDALEWRNSGPGENDIRVQIVQVP